MENTASKYCPSCGTALPMDAQLGSLCPKCLLKAGFASGAAVSGTSYGEKPRVITPTVQELQPHFHQLEIQQLIGHGGMGAVYKARQVKLNRMVALKILARNDLPDARFAERFQREAQALAQLNHPNIVTVYDFGETGGFFFLLMEFVDGLNLRELEEKNRLLPEQALAIVPPLCEALQYAHGRGIIHRDIKPENILIDKDGKVKIADFGIARILGTETSPGEPLTGEFHRVGTPHYMAPEQVEKPSAVDHRADIYSLGVVLYEMLTGELPLGRFAPPSRKVQVDVRLDDIVLKALEKEPELRYQHASEVKTSVDQVISNPLMRESPGHSNAQINKTERVVYPPFDNKAEDVASTIYGIIPLVLIMIAAPFFTRNEIALVGIYLGLGTAFLVLITRLLHVRYEIKMRREGCSIENDFTNIPDDSPSKLCVPALLGAILTILSLLMLFALFFEFQGEIRTPSNINGTPSRLMLLLTQLPVAATVLGFIGIARIRISRGHRYGMGLALFSALTFPIIVFTLITWLVLSKLTETYLNGIIPDFTYEAMATLTAVIALESTIWIARKLRGESISPLGSLNNKGWRGFACALYAFLATKGIISGINNLSEFYGLHSPARLTAIAMWAGVAVLSIRSLYKRLRHQPINWMAMAIVIFMSVTLAGGLWLVRTHQQDALIMGKVIDSDTGKPIALASITLDSVESSRQPLGSTTTNNAGNFNLSYPQSYHFLVPRQSNEELPDARIHVFSAGYETESLTWEKYYAPNGSLIRLKPRNDKAASINSANNEVTLNSTYLHTPGKFWSVAINAHNNSNELRYLTMRTSLKELHRTDGDLDLDNVLSGEEAVAADLQEQTYTLNPGFNAHIERFNSALLSRRPLELQVQIYIDKEARPNLATREQLLDAKIDIAIWKDISRELNALNQLSKQAQNSESAKPQNQYAWKSREPVMPPDWNRFFPDDKAASEELAQWAEMYDGSGKDDRPTSEILATVRNGLRNLRVDRRMPVLRYIGNRYIWNQSKQDPEAIELMYHAADPKADASFAYSTRGAAIYFGLSVVKDKSPALLKLLAELAMQSDDPNDLDRIAWGTRSNKQEMLEIIKTYANDEQTSGKAETIRKIFSGELKAFAWAAERTKLKASDNFTTQLPSMKTILTSGTSEERTEVLHSILQNRISLIMDESFMPAFAAAAADDRMAVRKNIAIIVGDRWVWKADQQSSAAIELMMKLSEDSDREVRYNAVYYGLSVVRDKSDAVIDRMVQMILEDGEKNLVQRIVWGLKENKLKFEAKLRHKITSAPASAQRESALEILEQLQSSKAN